ncbi:MAG: metal ABC transporter ATP-binding protein [Thermomicrobiales bacterium]
MSRAPSSQVLLVNASPPQPSSIPACPPDGAVIRTDHLTIHYDRRAALDNVSVAFAPRERVAIIGPNGAGKSTLLKAIAGMLPPSHGQILLNDKPLSGTDPRITYVPQRAGADWTFPISVLDVVLLGMARTTPRWRRFGGKERARALQALRDVAMDHLAGVQIGSLSGGQQQRVFLARALVQCSDILLLDEPFAGVDIPTQETFIQVFDQLTARGATIVFATHDLLQAREAASRAVLLNRTVNADGPPAEAMSPASLARTFGGEVMVLPLAAPASSSEPELALR